MANSDPLIGALVSDRYRILRMIGEGGMGRVYLAEQRMGTAARAVAIKVLTTSKKNDEEATARFYRECETVISLTHPNTIKFYDFGQLNIPLADGTLDTSLFIAMEYVDGRSLATAIEGGPIPLPKVERLVRQIGGALAEAHRRGIIHRDLKPDNVLLAHSEEEDEIPKVCDFGIAKKDDGIAPNITAQNIVIGTPAYMSPEQVSGHPVDERSDVYALALMTYEMLTGSRPFVAKTAIEWATAHLTKSPRGFDEFQSTMDLPSEKRVAIMNGMAKNVEQRTPSVRRFVEEFCGLELRSFSPYDSGAGLISSSAPTVAAPGTPSPRGIPAHDIVDEPPRSSSLLATFAGLSVLLAFGGFALWAYLTVAHSMIELGEKQEKPPETEAVPEWLRILHFEERARYSSRALGPPDQRCAQIRAGGTLTLELTPGLEIATDGTSAADIRIVVSSNSGPYEVQVGVERRDFTRVAAGVSGSMPLDIDQFEIPHFRYVKVKNRASSGIVCLDAIAAFHHVELTE